MSWRVVEQAIINASPLIFFSRSGHLDLLQAFANEVWVPEPVAREILQRGAQDITANAIEHTAWLGIRPAPPLPQGVLEWRLGPGESSVLALATTQPGTEVIIDDLAGRKCAASLNILLRGTLGIVLLAKRHGLIPQARPVIESMMSAGLYLSRRVLDNALRRVAE